MTAHTIRTLAGKWLGIAYLLLAAAIGGLWYAAVAAYEEAVMRERGRELHAIADLKIEFVRAWLEERRGDAAVLAGLTLPAEALAVSNGAAAMQALARLFDTFRAEYGYEAILLYDAAGRLRAKAGPPEAGPMESTWAAARQAMEGGQAHVSRAYHAGSGEQRHVDIDFAVPVVHGSGGGARVAGALVLHSDPRRELDPMLSLWPAPSESGETFLVERVEGKIAYLSSLRHADASKMQKPVSDPALPAAIAARGKQGVTEGLDYRHIPVLAAVGQVPGMPWFVVAKLDRAEILAPVRRHVRVSGTLTALLVLVLGLAMLAWHRRNQSELALAQEAADKQALAASEARFRKLHEHGWDFNVLFDRDMVVRYASPSIDRFLGHDTAVRSTRYSAARVHPDEVARVEAARQAALAQPGVPQHFAHRVSNGDGEWIYVEACFTNYFDDPDIDAFAYTARDISRRLEAERLLRESEERYRYLFELSPDAVFVHQNNCIRYANEATARLFHTQDVSDLIGHDWHDLCPQDHWPSIESRINDLMSGKVTSLPPVEQRLLTLDGSEIQVEATAARIVIDGAMAIMVVLRDISERRQAEARRLAEARRQRDTLVREVHHRIKNHLQGLTGLLNQHKQKHPALQEALDTVIAQITAISLIHGLQSREVEGEVRLYGLLKEIVAFHAGMASLAFANDGQPECLNCAWHLADAESVPHALILNELITNAIKHRDEPSAPVRVACACNDENIVVTLGNAGTLPPGFDFAAGAGLGTGLTLLRSLLPRNGAALSFTCKDGQVETRLVLSAPVVSRQREDQVVSLR